MAWIELHQSLWTHKKTILLAAILDIDELYAAAHMSKFWTWALDNAQDGDISDLPNRVIAFGAGWKGDPDIFATAIRKAGWIDGDGTIHDWFDYAGRLIEKKNANKERMKKARATNEQRTNNEQPEHVQGLPNLTIPNQTEPNLGEIRAPEDKIYALSPFNDPHKDRINACANEMQLKGIDIDSLEDVFEYIGRVDLEVIEHALKKAKGKHLNYAITILQGLVAEGKTTKESIIVLPPSQNNKSSPHGSKRDRPQMVKPTSGHKPTAEELEEMKRFASKLGEKLA